MTTKNLTNPGPARAPPRLRLRAATALTLALLVAGSGLASHMAQYTHNPVAHDDLGRSDEPDFAATGVLGQPVGNCVVDLGRDGRCDPDPVLPGAGVLAPGCTQQGSRLPSGTCGLMTVGVGAGAVPLAPVGFSVVPPLGPGTSMGEPPGRFPSARFLDARADVQPYAPYATAYVDLRHPVADLGPALGSPPALPQLLGSTGFWAWFGDWEDKNGNGVIDHLTAPCAEGTCAAPENEFVWRGRCLDLQGQFRPEAVANGLCAQEDTSGVDFLYPGTYKASASVCVENAACLPGTLPGNRVVALAGSFYACPDEEACLLPTLARQDQHGDPLLGGPPGTAPDEVWHDRSGDPADEVRHWVRGQGWPTLTYDAGVLTTTLHVSAFGCAARGAGVDLASCRYTDVDRYGTVSPVAGELLTATVRPFLAGQWTVAATAAKGKFLPPDTFSTDPCEGYEDAVDDAGVQFLLITVATADGCEMMASATVSTWGGLGGDVDSDPPYSSVPEPYACGRPVAFYDNVFHVPDPVPGDPIPPFHGTSGNDLIYGTMSTDDIHGGDGDDCVFGFGGNDRLEGGDGDDWVFGGPGIDVIHGDLATGSGTGADHLYGGDGDEYGIDGGAGADLLYGGDGDDDMRGGTGDDNLWGGDGDDHMAGDDILGSPLDGDDDLYGGRGNDHLSGGDGDDDLSGGEGQDHLGGSNGYDTGDCGLLDGVNDTFSGVEVAYYCP